MLAKLPFRWHWHVVEGVAALRHDTAWSTANGGRVTDDIHREGRSNDGTSEYLDDLAARFLVCGDAERHGLLAALDGRFVPAGPAGSPGRGRLDCLPTGRGKVWRRCLMRRSASG